MDTRQTNQLNDIYDELIGSRKALEGVQALLAGCSASKVDAEMMCQLLGTCNNRLKGVEARFGGIISS